MKKLLLGYLGISIGLGLFAFAQHASAVTCSITVDTVVNQAWVDAGQGMGACDDIEINGNVSTTWVGTVDVSGGSSGTVTVKSGNIMTMGSSSAMILGSTDDFIIEANATTTHVQGDTNGIKLTARNITVNGDLSALGKGCSGGGASGDHGYGINVSTGGCERAVGGYGAGGAGGGGGGGGGSHAGAGGGGGPSAAGGSVIYGNSLLPTFFGSGGGTGYYSTAFGGAGGGVIYATSTGTLTVNGRILADGAIGLFDGIYNGGGGGAGGSVYVRAGTIAGSGSISANGGGGAAGGGGGGGGRTVVYYGALSGFSLSNITSSAGLGGAGGGWGNGRNGATGTTYILDRYTDDGNGTLTITSSFDFPDGGDYTRTDVHVSSGVTLGCSAATTLTVHATNWLSLDNVVWNCDAAITTFNLGSTSGLSTTNTSMTFSGTTTTNISTPFWTNVTTSIALTKDGARTTWNVESDLTLTDFTLTTNNAGYVDIFGGFLFVPESIGINMVSSTISANVSSTSLTFLTIDARSTINATSRGCPHSVGGYSGAGPSPSTGVCAISVGGFGTGGGGSGAGGGGAAHAGSGGAGAGVPGNTATYGSSTYPIAFGSSGGGGYYINSAPGGRAGGVVHVVVSGALTVDGSLRADGTDGVYGGSWNGGGGGSGGSINLSVGTLAGSGVISANGGAGSDGGGGGGGGGGGRIAMQYSGLTFSGTSSTSAGAAGDGGLGVAGGEGSIYVLQLNVAPDVPSSLDPATLVNGSTTGTNTPTFNFTLSDPDVDTVQYRIQIDDSSDFSSPLVDYTSAHAAEGARSFQVGQAAGGGTYNLVSSSSTLPDGSFYWRVKAIDAAMAESSYTVANSGAVAFIVDTVPRYLSFLHETETGLESVTATSVRVMLNAMHFEDVTVSYAASAASAEGGGTDFTVTSTSVTITAGQTSTTIPLTVIDDLIDEVNETFTITLSSPTNAIIGSNTSTIYTIVDDDSAGVTLTPALRSLSEGGASSTYTIVLDTKPTSTVQVILSPPSDLTVSTSTLTFTTDNWNVPQTVTVNATQDVSQEGTHIATTTHVTNIPSGFAFGYAALSIDDFVATIADDETASIAVSASSLTIREGLTGTYTVVLGTAPTTSVQVLLSSGSYIALSTSTLTFTASNYNTPQSVTVTASNDTIYTGTRSTSITQTVSTTAGGFSSLTLSALSIAIADDESQGGGAAGSGGGGSVTPIALFTQQTPPSVIPMNLPPSLSPIPTSPSFPDIRDGVLTVQNPSDPARLAEVAGRPRDSSAEARALRDVIGDRREFTVSASEAQERALANFIVYGASRATHALGEGERRALVRDALQTMRTGNISVADLERLTQGNIPAYRNLAQEQVQLSRTRQTFRTIFGHDPNFQNQTENLAWNTLMYRIRFPRDLTAEREGIAEFRRTFRRVPQDPFQWAVVRVMGYVR